MSAALLLEGEAEADGPGADGETTGRDTTVRTRVAVPMDLGQAVAAGHSFNKMLDEALSLLDYSIEAGIFIEAELAQRLIDAKRRGDAAWADPAVGNLISDITRLAALLHPVTAATLRASQNLAHDTIRTYKWVAIILALFIVPWSVTSSIFTGINSSITADLATANQLAVSLHSQVGPQSTASGSGTQVGPINSLSDLQQFAANIRSIYRHTAQLIHFVPGAERDPVKSGARLELDPSLPNEASKIEANLDELTASYQQVRTYAKAVQDDGAAVYGAISTCILPIFYALLGACAYLLREFSDKLEKRTFAPTYSTVARFVIAAIGGGIIGLFNNFTTGQMMTLSPLAIAFLVGYGADVFFSFIEGSLQTVRKPSDQRSRSMPLR